MTTIASRLLLLAVLCGLTSGCATRHVIPREELKSLDGFGDTSPAAKAADQHYSLRNSEGKSIDFDRLTRLHLFAVDMSDSGIRKSTTAPGAGGNFLRIHVDDLMFRGELIDGKQLDMRFQDIGHAELLEPRADLELLLGCGIVAGFLAASATALAIGGLHILIL